MRLEELIERDESSLIATNNQLNRTDSHILVRSYDRYSSRLACLKELQYRRTADSLDTYKLSAAHEIAEYMRGGLDAIQALESKIREVFPMDCYPEIRNAIHEVTAKQYNKTTKRFLGLIEETEGTNNDNTVTEKQEA